MTPGILHFHCFVVLQDRAVTSYLSEDEARNLQNGDVYLAQIPLDFKVLYLENHLAH